MPIYAGKFYKRPRATTCPPALSNKSSDSLLAFSLHRNPYTSNRILGPIEQSLSCILDAIWILVTPIPNLLGVSEAINIRRQQTTYLVAIILGNSDGSAME